MRTAGHWLLVEWLVAALVLLGMGGRLPEFFAWAAPGSLLALGLWSLVRQQLAPSRYNRRRCRSATGWPTISGSRLPP